MAAVTVTTRAGLKARLKSVIPGWLWGALKAAYARVQGRWYRARFEVRLVKNYLYDISRFRRYSGDRPAPSRENLRAIITMDYHRVEKGLALRNPRTGFGGWFLPRLLDNLHTYQARHGPDEVTAVALNALAAYVDFNERAGHRPVVVREKLAELRRQAGEAACGTGEGGVRRLTAREVKDQACRDLTSFFRSRHSIRQFAGDAVAREVIQQAVSMAVYSPSVCNRESWRVHVFSTPEAKAAVLAYQNGNRGFGDQAAHVLIVATEVQSFVSAGERNQCWVDGGMFAMSLVYALHSLGVGTCCLNWCVEREKDAALKAYAGIPESQAVIMMIAVGSLPEEFSVAQSPRRGLPDVIVFHDSPAPAAGGGAAR
jgi:nitroreductase